MKCPGQQLEISMADVGKLKVDLQSVHSGVATLEGSKNELGHARYKAAAVMRAIGAEGNTLLVIPR